MKTAKRIMAFFLCLLMIRSDAVTTITQATVSSNDAIVQTTDWADTVKVCEECGSSGTHAETCSFYTINTLTTETTTEATQTTTESTTTPTGTTQSATTPKVADEATGCTECGGTEEHLETCSQYVIPANEVNESDTPQVGDTIWIKSGSLTYKQADATSESREVILKYETKIVSIVTDESGNAVWYEFKPTGFLEIFKDYKYVHVDNTSEEEPEATESADENVCTCGETAPENLADHADSCPRKQYVNSLFENKTAEEIYAEWDNYDQNLHTDIFNMLKVYDEEKFEQLNVIVNCTCGTTDGEHKRDCPFYDGGGFDIVHVQYEATASSGTSATIIAAEGAFPVGSSVSVTDTDVSSSQVSSLFSGDVKGIVAVDISFGGIQPNESVVVTLSVPASKVPSDANKVYVIHFGNNGAELVSTSYLDTSSSGELITFTTDGFSTYAAVFVNSKYNSQKMSSLLSGNSRYSIATFPVDLFDYDYKTINSTLNAATSDGNGFHFTGYGIDGCSSNNGINNTAATHAKQGILSNIINNGLPDFNYLTGSNAGIKTGQILFDDNYAATGKTIYDDVDFEFIYDNQTGYYEYKSSANHAQYNSSTNKIELYADTLSTNNSYLKTLDLSTASGTNDYQSITKTSSSFKATANELDDNGHFDPYVTFSVPYDSTSKAGTVASTVGQIYVKAKVPAGVGTNQFQLFFDTSASGGMAESKSHKVTYTANGDWIEFVLNTSEITNWPTDSATCVTNIRIDLFDGYFNGLNSTKTYDIEIAQISLIKKVTDDPTDPTANTTLRGGFYPFSDIQDSYPGSNNGFSYSSWEALMNSNAIATALASRSIFNPTYAANTDLYEELAYGMVMEFDFYLPVEKTGEDLTYYFSGDDDLWVFVDDQLVLDIGGGHAAITGYVNFSTGARYVQTANTVTGYNSGADGSYGTVNDTINSSLMTAGKHTMKIFYLERGGSVSNCYMKFNLPQTPQGNVVVSKTVVETNDEATEALTNAEFEFTISAKNLGSGGTDTVTPLANADYILVNGDTTTVAKKTSQDGKFTLKDGQKALFVIDENYEVTVTETKKVIADYQYESTTVNGTSGMTATATTAQNKESEFRYVNTYTHLFGTLVIEKNGISDLDNNKEETQNTIFVISGKTNTGEDFCMEVTIMGNNSVTIQHIPTGNYTVTEKTDWSWRYEPEENSKSVTVIGGQTAKTKFENKRTEKYWLSGDCYAENWWGGDKGTVVRKDENDED